MLLIVSGYRKCPPPPPLPPRGQKGRALPPVPPPSSKKSLQEVPKGQDNPSGKQLEYKRKLFRNPLKHKRLGLLTPTKLTPVKLLCSPFLQRRSGSKKGVVGMASQAEKAAKHPLSPQGARENLESLAEAQIYGLPIIPFPYSAERRRLIATGPKLNLKSQENYGNIVRKLEFDDQTPLGVRALATPAGKRRLVFEAEDLDARHCRSCTCNQHQAVSRREMLTRHRLEFLPSLSSLSNNNNLHVSRPLPTETKPQPLASEVDYVKMSGGSSDAKLV